MNKKTIFTVALVVLASLGVAQAFHGFILADLFMIVLVPGLIVYVAIYGVHGGPESTAFPIYVVGSFCFYILMILIFQLFRWLIKIVITKLVRRNPPAAPEDK